MNPKITILLVPQMIMEKSIIQGYGTGKNTVRPELLGAAAVLLLHRKIHVRREAVAVAQRSYLLAMLSLLVLT